MVKDWVGYREGPSLSVVGKKITYKKKIYLLV